MKIAVCVKQVPDTETRIKIAPSGTELAEADVNFVLSPYDEFAIEEALRLKEAHGGEVVLCSVGADRVQTALRSGLAMGADRAIHVKDPLLLSACPFATATALAAALKTLLPLDLVLTGQQGVGGDNSQVPGLLAAMLDLPQVTVCVKIEIQGASARVEREVEGGREVWECPLPALFSAQKGLNEPRYASLKGIMAAKKKPIDVLDSKALGLDAASLSPRTVVTALELPPQRPPVRLIEGDPEAQAKTLIELLHAEAKVI